MSLLYVSTNWIDVSQNAALYDKPVVSSKYDFVINVPVIANSLFTYRNYRENSENNENVDINLQISSAHLMSQFVKTISTMPINPATESALQPTSADYPSNVLQTIGDHSTGTDLGRRFLEIAAIKIFGSAYATAAIRNDKDFSSQSSGKIYDQISTQMASIDEPLNGDGLADAGSQRLSVFNAYVASGKYNSLMDGDKTDVVDFNFRDTVWEFPIYFSGSLTNSDDSTISMITPGVRYGAVPTYAGQTPVLLRLVDTLP
jgi:hypothetical protein